jgi:hypothetical protein
MSSPDDDERSDDFPNSDYAPKWKRDSYRQGSPDTAKGEPPPSFLRRSLDPEIVHPPQRARSLWMLRVSSANTPTSSHQVVARYTETRLIGSRTSGETETSEVIG